MQRAERRALAVKTALLFLSCALDASVAAPTNILFVLADDQGFGDVGFTAAQGVQPGAGGAAWKPNPPRTPHLDALSAAPGTLIFDRFYAGSPVCSPTRSALLTGRTPDRECVFNAEGCGQVPAWSCVDPQPFPGGWAAGESEIFTVANAAADAGFATLHSGKWHLGNFFPKSNANPSYAYKKWPVMHPGHVGFSEWYSTEASASSTMCNCGCEAAWPSEAPGCVMGGGAYVLGKSFPCTNYWQPANLSAACLAPSRATLPCVANITTKIPGDDSLFQLARFDAFLNASQAAGKPFFATLQLHTNHVPHPSLPQYFFAYNDTNGDPAGDYLGTLTQMDAAVGALVALLKQRGAFDNTLLWYAADNGPHPGKAGDGAGGIAVKNTASNGLRQCKASVFEGGIHVPALVSWPAAIRSNARTAVPVGVVDFLPTVLDLLGAAHPRPAFAADGESVLPLLRGAPFARSRFLAWRLEGQVALLDAGGRFKYVRNADAGQCARDAAPYPYNSAAPLVFDLAVDPTESAPVANATLVAELDALARAWESSIAESQVNESKCLPAAAQPARLQRNGAGCLAATALAKHAPLSADAACAASELNSWTVDAVGAITLHAAASGAWCFHNDAAAKQPCARGTAVFMGQACSAESTVVLAASDGTLRQPSCPGMCAGVTAHGALALADCAAAEAKGWEVLGGGRRGMYAQPLD